MLSANWKRAASTIFKVEPFLKSLVWPDNLHEKSNHVFWEKKKKNIVTLFPAEFAYRVVKVNIFYGFLQEIRAANKVWRYITWKGSFWVGKAFKILFVWIGSFMA